MPTPEQIAEEFRRAVLRDRPHFNLNNPRRTDYYLEYWRRHPEIWWALLAHLVSRNAGWAMSDLARYVFWSRSVLVGRPAVLVGADLIQLSILQLLEVANFLIFYDVYPQLEAYAWAKREPDASDRLFDTLASEPKFAADRFAVAQWKTFFSAASANADWLSTAPPTHPAIVQRSFSLIINEQNQIEDRLVNDPNERYLRSTGYATKAVVNKFDEYNLNLLAFPEATSETQPEPKHLLVYTARDFGKLAGRITIGRNLYVGLFTDPQRRALIAAWAKSQPTHYGTRVDYNPGGYSTSRLALIPNGKKYSPPLREVPDHDAVWALDPTTWWFSRHLHDDPVALPKDVGSRDASTVAGWLAPNLSPTLLETKPLRDYYEVLI
jgi:Protein of unknown function (DUF2515)